MRFSNELDKIGLALSEIQKSIRNPIKNQTNKGVRGEPKYANLEDTLSEYVRPICSENGVAIVQSLNTDEKGRVGVCTLLLHESGQFIESDYVYCDVVIPLNKEGKKTLTEGQATGVCITYLRRYSLNAALGINGDKDTDGSYSENEPLTLESSLNYEITFGKHNGKTLQEIIKIDASYIEWLANKGNDEVKRAISIIKESSNSKEPEYPEVKCPKCGIQILKAVSPNGKIWTPEEILKKYGMCQKCYESNGAN